MPYEQDLAYTFVLYTKKGLDFNWNDLYPILA